MYIPIFFSLFTSLENYSFSSSAHILMHSDICPPPHNTTTRSRQLCAKKRMMSCLLKTCGGHRGALGRLGRGGGVVPLVLSSLQPGVWGGGEVGLGHGGVDSTGAGGSTQQAVTLGTLRPRHQRPASARAHICTHPHTHSQKYAHLLS